MTKAEPEVLVRPIYGRGYRRGLAGEPAEDHEGWPADVAEIDRLGFEAAARDRLRQSQL